MNKHSTQKRFTEEFKIEAVRQITDRGHKVADVAERLGVSAHSLYKWLKRYPEEHRRGLSDQYQAKEMRRLTDLIRHSWQSSGQVYG